MAVQLGLAPAMFQRNRQSWGTFCPLRFALTLHQWGGCGSSSHAASVKDKRHVVAELQQSGVGGVCFWPGVGVVGPCAIGSTRISAQRLQAPAAGKARAWLPPTCASRMALL